MLSQRNIFTLMLVLSILRIDFAVCNKTQEEKHAEHEEYDINSAPMPSLHDGPQLHSRWVQTITTTEKVKHEQHHHFVHKIENSPLPSAHEGPQPLKMAKRSAPMALDNKFKDTKVDVEENYRELPSGEISLNPQKPKYADETTTSDFSKDIYNYYGVRGNYGSNYKYNYQQPFSGYYPTSNIGVVPPKKANAKDYYNSISNLAPALRQHGGVYSELRGKSSEYLPQYGSGGVEFNSNAYQNVIAGLLIWNSLNKRDKINYDIYNSQNITNQLDGLTFSADSLEICEEPQKPLCTEDTKPFCTTKKYVFCSSTKFKTCQTNENMCVDDNNNNKQELMCIKNITLTDTQEIKNLNLGEFTNKTLCVVTVAVPKI